MIRKAKRGEDKIFLEVFCGDGNLSVALRKRRCTVFSIDIRRGPHHDLRVAEVFNTVRGWLQAKLVWGTWLGTPCNSFSKARRAPPGSSMPSALRSPACPRGLPDLPENDRAKLREGNALADRAGQLQRLALSLGVLGGEENPASSYLWALASRQKFLQLVSVQDVVCDYCAFGRPFRARTRLRLWGGRPLELQARCSGRGTCSYSGRPHEQLTGTAGKEFATAKKNSYPEGLCSILASYFVRERKERQAVALWTRMRA